MHPNDLTAFLITWRTYGTWLPGDERGWVDQRRNGRGEPTHPPDYRLENAAKGHMKAAAVMLDESQRRAVDEAIRFVCADKAWVLHAVNVRTNHVHVVLSSSGSPERTQVALKAAATRVLRQRVLMPPADVLWSRGGSQRRLPNQDSLMAAVDYVRTVSKRESTCSLLEVVGHDPLTSCAVQ